MWHAILIHLGRKKNRWFNFFSIWRRQTRVWQWRGYMTPQKSAAQVTFADLLRSFVATVAGGVGGCSFSRRPLSNLSINPVRIRKSFGNSRWRETEARQS